MAICVNAVQDSDWRWGSFSYSFSRCFWRRWALLRCVTPPVRRSVRWLSPTAFQFSSTQWCWWTYTLCFTKFEHWGFAYVSNQI